MAWVPVEHRNQAYDDYDSMLVLTDLSGSELLLAGLLFAVAALLFHAYVGYPLLIKYIGGILPRPSVHPRQPGASVLVFAAHNEEAVIAEKLENALALEPADLRVVVVSDGSTDGTDRIAEEYGRRSGRVELIRIPERRGKNHALNCALAQLRLHPDTVVVFTDANAVFRPDAVLRLRERLASGAWCTVGKLVFTDAVSGTARAEGLYWRYENGIKAAEGAIGRLPFANGAIFAAMASEIDELPHDTGNDFWIPMTMLGDGRAVVYEPAAVALEAAPQEAAEEFARKVRMANRQMCGVLSAWKHLDGPTRFQVVSHKVIRWFGLPLLAIAAAAAALLWGAHPAFRASLAIAFAPFFLGGLGFAGRWWGVRIPIADLAVHFLVVHWAALCGVVEALLGKRRSTWAQAASSRAADPGGGAPAHIGG